MEYVKVGDSLDVACYTNMDGSMTYQCVYNETTGQSKLELKESTCIRLACIGLNNKLVNVGDMELSLIHILFLP